MGSQMPWARFSETNSQTLSQPLSQSSQSVEGSRGSTPITEPNVKASWDRNAIEALIKICVEEVQAGNRPGSHFSKIGWENIRMKFRETTNRDYSRVQLKNRWDSLKKDWSVWTNLLRNSTGLGWDIRRGTVQASKEWWTQKIQQIPEAAKFQAQGPLLVHEQEILFADVVATGEGAWTPSSGMLPPNLFNEPNTNVEGPENDINELEADHESERGAGPDNFEFDPFFGSDDTQCTNANPSRSRARSDSGLHERIIHKKQKKITSADKIARSIDRMVDKFTTASAPCNDSTGSTGHYTIKACVDVLYTMSGVEESDRLWMLAVRLFLKPAVRELFLSFRTNIARLKWLQEQYERDIQRNASSIPSAYASRGDSHHNDDASSR